MSLAFRETRDVLATHGVQNVALLSGKKYKCIVGPNLAVQKKTFKFKAHQQRVIDYCLLLSKCGELVNQRGILLYHTLGLGKTCTSIGIADTLLSTGNYDGVVVLLPAGLRANYVQEYCAKCGLKYVQEYARRFSFYAYNYSGILPEFPETLDNCIIIIDEIHNLIAGRLNKSTIRAELFERVVNSENCFIVGLSGTPIYSSVHELYYLGKMFYKYNPLHLWHDPDFDREKFDVVLQNESHVAELLKGVSSYVTPEDNQHYPRIKTNNIILVPITHYGASAYSAAIEKEKTILNFPECKKITGSEEAVNKFTFFEEPKEFSSKSICYLAITKFFSTRTCNIVYPELNKLINALPYDLRIQIPEPNRIVDLIHGLSLWEKGSDISELAYKILELRKERPDMRIKGYELESYDQTDADPKTRNSDDLKVGRLLVDRNVIYDNTHYFFSDSELSKMSNIDLTNLKNLPSINYLQSEQLLRKYSPKFWAVLDHVQRVPGKHAIFCHFLLNSGVYLLSAILTMNGIPNLVYSGVLSMEDRQKLLRQFNNENNLTGEKYRAILLTDAGTEGLSLMATENIHIVSPKINQNKINQVIGRVRRLHSHDALPKDRQYVNIFYYLVTFNPGYFFKEIPNIDVKRLITGSEEIIQYFDDLIKHDYTESIDSDYFIDRELSSDLELYQIAMKREYTIQKALNILQMSSLEQISPNEIKIMDIKCTFNINQLKRILLLIPGGKDGLSPEENSARNKDLRDLRSILGEIEGKVERTRLIKIALIEKQRMLDEQTLASSLLTEQEQDGIDYLDQEISDEDILVPTDELEILPMLMHQELEGIGHEIVTKLVQRPNDVIYFLFRKNKEGEQVATKRAEIKRSFDETVWPNYVTDEYKIFRLKWLKDAAKIIQR